MWTDHINFPSSCRFVVSIAKHLAQIDFSVHSLVVAGTEFHKDGRKNVVVVDGSLVGESFGVHVRDRYPSLDVFGRMWGLQLLHEFFDRTDGMDHGGLVGHVLAVFFGAEKQLGGTRKGWQIPAGSLAIHNGEGCCSIRKGKVSSEERKRFVCE